MPVQVEIATVEVRECMDCPWHQLLATSITEGIASRVEMLPCCEMAGNRALPARIDELATPPAWCPLRGKLTIVALTSRIVT